jgi:hypothetical protein
VEILFNQVIEFFKWLKEVYGMKLDIYAFVAGAIDGGGFYGNIQCARFKRQFHDGFAPVADKASSIGIRCGIWIGPEFIKNTT